MPNADWLPCASQCSNLEATTRGRNYDLGSCVANCQVSGEMEFLRVFLEFSLGTPKPRWGHSGFSMSFVSKGVQRCLTTWE